MNKFIIIDGLPYLYAEGKAYAVRWDSAGFTVGAEIELKSVPAVLYTELSIKAQCANNLNSIGAEPENEPENTVAESNPENEPENTVAESNPENEPENTVADQDEPEKEKALDDMSPAELKEYAKAHEIELNGARTKATIIETIKAAKE